MHALYVYHYKDGPCSTFNTFDPSSNKRHRRIGKNETWSYSLSRGLSQVVPRWKMTWAGRVVLQTNLSLIIVTGFESSSGHMAITADGRDET